MYVENIGEIKAVAFDIDGTLYREKDLYLSLVPYGLRHGLFFIKYSRVRKQLHRDAGVHQFMRAQALLMAKGTTMTTSESAEMIDRIVYKGLKKYFERAKPCEYVVELVKKLKEAGFKIALLSDFPPEQKGEVWGIKQYCDVIMGTEAEGALKPSPFCFRMMAKKLDVPEEQILYVGNSYRYDVIGSKNAGLKAAWFIDKKKKSKLKGKDQADIMFRDYYELEKKILGNQIKN